MSDWVTQMELWVPGTPVPQGSYEAIPLGRWVGGGAGKRFVPVTRKDGMPIINVVDGNREKLKPWRELVTARAIEAWGGRDALDGDVQVWSLFVFPRPKGHYGTGRNAGTLKPSAPTYKRSAPDKDKLERALFDALTDAGVWTDDARAVDGGSKKVYGLKPGVRVWVQTTTSKEDPLWV